MSNISPDAARERQQIDLAVQKRYYPVPLAVSRVVLAIILMVVLAVTVNNIRVFRNIELAATLVAMVIGLFVGLLLASKTPALNRILRAAVVRSAKNNYSKQFDEFRSGFELLVTAVTRFDQVVSDRLYNDYVGAERDVHAYLVKLRPAAEFLFTRETDPLPQLDAQAKAAQALIESDENAVLAYEPDVLRELTEVSERAAAGNIPDCYRAWHKLGKTLSRLEERTTPFDFTSSIKRLRRQTLSRLEERTTPFDFTSSIKRLRRQWQQFSDKMCADSGSREVWLNERNEIARQEEEAARLEERRRHNKAMEEAAQEVAQEAQRQTELKKEQVMLAREKRDAARVEAVATGVVAWQTRKTAQATRELADQGRRRADR